MTPSEVLAGIRDANYHAGGIRVLRLLKVHDEFFAALKSEVVRLCDRESPSDTRDSHHIANWTRPRGEVAQFSLLNASGRCDDFSDDHTLSSHGKRFHLGADYPCLDRFIGDLPHAINVRVNFQGSRAKLTAHEEHSIIRTRTNQVGACVRFHLPIETNHGAELILDGQVFHLEPAIIHFVNHGCVHATRNGPARRMHIVWDMLLTREAYQATFGDGPTWATRMPIAERVPLPLRIERMGAYVRLPSPVGLDEAARLDFCEPQ